jgi:hypothetical protein
MAAFAFKSAKGMVVKVGNPSTTPTVNIPVKSCNIEYTAQEIDTSNSESGGYTSRIAGFYDAKITLELDWDSGNGTPFGTPYNLDPGAQVSIYIYPGGTAGASWQFPIAQVLTAPSKLEVKSAVGGSITLGNFGQFTKPTTSF